MRALSAPRILNEPVIWTISSFSHTSDRRISDSHGDGIIGVRVMNGARRAAAASISLKSGAWVTGMRARNDIGTPDSMHIVTAAAPPFFKNGYLVACEHTAEAVIIDPGDEIADLLETVKTQRLAVKA